REFLVIADAAVNKARVAGNMLKRPPGRDVATALANDERKLALEVEIVGHFGANQLAAMPDQCVGKARLFRQFARHLRRMRAIIDAGAENLPRLRDYRQKFYVVELAIRRGALRDAAHLFHRAGSERRAETGLPDFIVERDDAVIAQRAEPVLAV